MASYTGTANIYNEWKATLGKGANLSTDSFKLLLTESGYTPNTAVDAVLADITNEVSGNGYARQTLGNVVFSQTSGTAKFDFDDVVFTASGGSITARYWVIYDDTLAGDPLVAWGLLNNAASDVETTDGNTLTFQVNAAGLFTLA